MAMASPDAPSATLSVASPLPRLVSMPSSCRLPLLQHHPMRHHPKLPCRIRAATPAITFHVENTSITVPMSQAAARGVGTAIGDLLNTFKEKANAERPRRWESMEFRHSEDGVFLEMFCNPNAYANAFQAKVMITISDEKIKITSEGHLSAVKADIDQYVEAYV